MKERLDNLMYIKKITTSIEKAKALIMAGLVFVNDEKIEKPGIKINYDSKIIVKDKSMPYVSRGGLKFEKALKYFQLDLKNKIMMDIGSSTGGFTDCALKNNIKKVYAIDVGYGQLDWSLRNNPKVVTLERTNFRYLTTNEIKEKIDIVSVDVSFISAQKILFNLPLFLNKDADIIVLIKPQFEAEKEYVNKGGIIKDINIHKLIIKNFIEKSTQLNFKTINLSYSPIKGAEGNIEFLAHLKYMNSNESIVEEAFIDKILKESHSL